MTRRLYRNRYRISSTRLRGWDYRCSGIYAVTICVEGRACCLGEIAEGQMVRSRLGDIVAEEWLRIPEVHPHVALNEWIVMPDHVHGILVFQTEKRDLRAPGLLTSGSLGAVVGQFKQRSTKRIRARRYPDFRWQERFFDQILRDDDALQRYRAYIRENPRRWSPGRR
jgi:putative transposase